MTNNSDEKLFIELGVSLSPTEFKRNIVVQDTPEVIQEHRQKYKNTDVFSTVLRYDSSDIRNANQQGPLSFDLDKEDNPQLALNEVRKLVAFLIKQECPENAIRIWFSGLKGFHVQIVFEALGIEPNEKLNAIYKIIATNIKNTIGLTTFDTVVYDKVRLWRLSNSINSKSGLYKIPLYPEELEIPLEGIKEMAQYPRPDIEHKTAEVWLGFAELFEKAKSLRLQVYETSEPVQLKDSTGCEMGSRDDTMLKLAESLLSRNYNELEVWDTMSQVNRTYKPPLDDSSMNRLFRQAANFIASKKSPATNSETYRGSGEMSQETKLENVSATNEDDMPKPILLSEISAEQYTIDWLWEGFIARGHKTLLSSLWKAGKSTFIGLLLKAIEHGTPFAGQRTIPCNVLVLSEESQSQWVERREELALKSTIYILSNPLKYKFSYIDWIHWLEKIKIFCKEKEIELVIIDTISEFWSVNDENKAPEVIQALMPLNYLTEDNIGILLVHHFRKSGGTQGTAARGSGALGSKVDILIDFSRYEDEEQTTKRKLTCLSRFDETPREIVLDYVNGDYIVLGNSTEVKKQEKLTKMLEIFKEYTNGFTAKEVWENWDSFEQGKKPSKRTIQRYVADLMETKQVEKIEDRTINDKLVPFYKVIDQRQSTTPIIQNGLSQVNEAKTANEIELFEPETTHDKTTNPCYCGSTDFWQRPDGGWVCNRCHPQS